MTLLPHAFREGGRLAWRQLLPLLWLNLVWAALAWTLLLAGPATLTCYALIAEMREDREPSWRQFLPRLRRNLLPGLLWALSVVVFAWVAYSNAVFWTRRLGPFGDSLVWLLVAYLAWLFVALQPFLLEALSVERLPYARAWRAAWLGLLRRPLVAHLYVLIPLAGLLLGLLFRTFAVLILVSLTLAFAAVVVRPLAEPAPPPPECPEPPTPA